MDLKPVGAGTVARERWFGVGRSSDPDAGAAGRAAAGQALDGRDAKLLVVFCSDAYDLDQLLEAVNESSGDVGLVGCSTAGEIASSGPGDAGVVIVALGGEGFAVSTGVGTGLSERLRDAGAEAASCVNAIDERAHRILLLLTDGLAGDQQEIVRGAYSVAGAGVPWWEAAQATT